MRSEVQEILDKDWPDRKGKYYRYGIRDMYIALGRLAQHAEDIGDLELKEEACAQAVLIPDPDPEMQKLHQERHGKDAVRMINKSGPSVSNAHKFVHREGIKLLIFKEKHGTLHSVVNSPTETCIALLSILEQRLNDGFWYMDELYGDDLPQEGEDPDQLDIFSSNQKPLTEVEQVELILNKARSGDPGCIFKAGKGAYQFLINRCDNEYEGFEYESPETPKFDLTKIISVL